MTARDVIAQALALSEAATDRWEVGAGWAFEFDPADPPTDRLRNVFKAERWAELERREEDETRVQRNIEFAVAARTLLPAFAKALGGVLKPGITEPHEWLQGMKTYDIEGAEPGNREYMAHLERVLRAMNPGRDIPWAPICLAIVLDRGVRATEDSVAITAALSEVTP